MTLAEQLIEALKTKKMVVHNCSFCGYACGYFISDDDVITYDSGCHCVRDHLKLGGLRKVSTDELESFISGNTMMVRKFIEGEACNKYHMTDL